jgi:hypothetical protein
MRLKATKLLAMAVLVLTVAFTGCEKEEIIPDGPLVTFSGIEGTSITVDFATTDNNLYSLSFTVEVDAPGEIEKFTMIRKKINGTTEVDEDLFDYTPGNVGKTETTYQFTGSLDFTHFVNENFDAIEFQFIVEDKNGKVGDKVFTVKDDTKFPQTKQGLFYHIQGPDHGAYDLDGDATVGSAGAATVKSMVNTDASQQAFTGKWTSETSGNGTLFQKVTYNFDTGHVREAMVLYNADNATSSVDSPAANDVYLAKKGDKYYVIKITSIDPTAIGPSGNANTVNKGKMEFTYKKY